MPKKPATKYPAQPIVYWPPQGGVVYVANPAEKHNWWTAAEACGRKNVWEVIYFNFQTLDPVEVNWYLENYVNCTKMDKKKKSYGFGGPGGMAVVVYLPPPEWMMDPSVKLPQPPVRPATNAWDGVAAQYALNVLSTPQIDYIDFQLGPYHINFYDFYQISQRIKSGTFGVYGAGWSAEVAEYDPENGNFLLFPGASATSRSYVVHEAVHAIFDLRKAHNVTTIDDEAAAYFAQTIWVQEYMLDTVEGPGGTRRDLQHTKNQDTEDIFVEAFKLYLEWSDGVELGNSDFDPLRAAVAKHDEYKVKPFYAGYDGVYEMGPTG